MQFLINPSERNILQDFGDRMPLGLLYIARRLEDVKVYDMNHTNLIQLGRDLRELRPETVGISCLTSASLNASRNLCDFVRTNSKAKIVVGGYHPSIRPQDFSEFADNVVVGEGENAEIGTNYIVNGKKVNIEGLTPNRKLLNPADYGMTINGKRFSTALTSRGCPNHCVFCGNRDRTIRYHTLDDVSNDLDEITRQGFKGVYFLDDVFTIDQDRSINISKLCRNRLDFRVTTRANYISDYLIEELSRNGLVCLSMGIESGNPEILEKIGKNQGIDQIRRAIKTCGKYKIPTKGFFIIGLPGETEETANQTIAFSKELRNYGLTSADFYPMIPFPGTEIWTNPDRYGIEIIDRDFGNYLQAGINEPTVPCQTEGLKQEQIKHYLRLAKKEWK